MASTTPVLSPIMRANCAADVIPGLTTAAVVVPFAAMAPMAVYAVLGSSRLLRVSTTTPIAILCATLAMSQTSATNCKY
jgi:MFS superfamily sulfate permease-like transporter